MRVEAGNLPGNLAPLKFGVAIACLIAGVWYFLPNPHTPIIVAIAAALLVGAVAQPFLVCLLFIAVSVFRLHEAYPFLYPLHLPLLLGVATVLALGLHVFVIRSVRAVWPPELKWFSVFFVITTLGLITAYNREVSWNFWTDVYWKIGLMTLAIAWLPRSAGDFAAAARIFVVGGTLVAAVTIYNAYHGIGLVELNRVTVGRELGSILGDPNDLALTLLFPLSFSIALALQRDGGMNRILGILGAGAIVAAMIFTQSRGGLLGMLAVFSAFALRQVRSKIVVTVLILVAGLILYDAMGISARISGGGTQQGLDESAQGRLDAWGAAINMAIARPFTGVGIANFSPSFYSYVENFPGRDMTSHSTWFGVLGETGWPGLIAFVGMVVACFRSGLKSHLRLKNTVTPTLVSTTAFALIAGLAGFCVAGSFLTQGFSWPIYILVGLTAAISRYSATLSRKVPTTFLNL